MPELSPIIHDPGTRLYLWKITEPLTELESVTLTAASKVRLQSMNSVAHRKGFLAVRKLLECAALSDEDLYYDEFGKPNLRDGRCISISHSHEFSVIAISTQKIGIDLELCRDKIINIASKFVEPGFTFASELSREDYIRCLTVDWGIKESIFKIRNEPGISFKDHILVTPFELTACSTTARLIFNGQVHHYRVYFRQVESYMLVYAFEDNV